MICDLQSLDRDTARLSDRELKGERERERDL
jgi:hypothetical protein